MNVSAPVTSGLPALSDLRKMKGDILSNMMALNESQQKAHGGSSTPPENLSDVIKTTAKQLTWLMHMVYRPVFLNQ